MVVVPGHDAWRALCGRATPLSFSHREGWLILAPHPDDETLGAGGLLAALADHGVPTWLVYLTSGEASHFGAVLWSSRRIGRTRRAESRCALQALGLTTRPPLFLGWPDSQPPPLGGAIFRRAHADLLDLCRRHGIRNIATTWRGEVHCDHRAAYDLGRSLVRSSGGGIRLFEYLVWGWTDLSLQEKVGVFEVAALDTAAYAERCRAALACHRTQATSLIRGAQKAFRLSPGMMALASRNPFILLHEGKSHAT
jgi:LmbE family N-acetylglucosaminyl deacetylase